MDVVNEHSSKSKESQMEVIKETSDKGSEFKSATGGQSLKRKNSSSLSVVL